MKKSLSLALLLVSRLVFAQTPYAIWEDQQNNNYRYVRLNPATGVKTNVATLPPLVGFVGTDASAYNFNLNRYHFVAQTSTSKILYTLNGLNGSVIFSPVMTNTVVGIEYNCADSTLYGIEVSGNTYNFVKVDPVTAAITVVAPVSNMQGYVGGSFSLDLQAQVYTFKALTSTVFKLRSLAVATGAVLYDNTFPDNVVGHKYSPTDNAVYGMWDNGGVYQLEKINYTAGTHSTVASYTVMSTGFLGQMFSMSQNGDYTLRAFDKNNQMSLFTLDCTSGAVINYSNTSDNAVGFEEPVCVTGSTAAGTASVPAFNLFPNPAASEIRISPAQEDCFLLEIYDARGTCVKRMEMTGETSLSLAQLPPGAYWLALSRGGLQHRKAFVVLK
jgi:hypothetical protein